MRSRSTSMHNNNKSMEVGRPKLKEEPHLSGAYIRSLVKQLSSSRPKESMGAPKTSDGALGDAHPQDPAKPSEGLGEEAVAAEHHHHHHSPQPQPKKQVRRRLHTSRPYQERLLNMAEARREIVTALKLHRASMKQASEQLEHNQPPIPPHQSPPPVEEPHQELLMDPRPRIYQPSSTSFPHYLQNPPFPPFTYPSLCWPYPPIAPLPISDDLNLPLPNQPLGLNLNFQGFNNIDTPFFNNKPTIQQLASPSSTSTSYSNSSPLTMSVLEAPSVSDPPPGAYEEAASDPSDAALHPAMDDEAMAEIRSIGEQHDMEWNDTMNLVTSAWWSRFLKTMEVGHEEREGDGFGHVFDEAADVPAWLSDDSPRCFDNHHMEEYLKDAALPCLDIEEIEVLDGDWLS